MPNTSRYNKKENKIDTEKLRGSMVENIFIGGFSNAIGGSLGKYGLSFSYPVLSSAAGSFWQLATLGAIALPLSTLPILCVDILIDQSDYLNERPNVKGIIKNISGTVILSASLISAALLIGLPPFGASVICSLVIPVLINAFGTLIHIVNAIIQTKDQKITVEAIPVQEARVVEEESRDDNAVSATFNAR